MGQMADQQNSNDSDSGSDTSYEVDRGLENFITHHYERQKEEGKMDTTEDISEERTNSFFERAIRESQRMSMEVERSHKKIDRLHDELGEGTFASWRNEH